MPKTHTDDIAPTLPAAVRGPFQVVDPNDPNAFFKLDPQAAAVEVAGGARPTRSAMIGLNRTIGTSGNATLGNGIACRQINTGDDAGFYTNPFWIPPDMDLSAPCQVYVMMSAAVASALSGVAVNIEVQAGYTRDQQAGVHTATIAVLHAVPDNWQTARPEEALVDDGSSRTFAPDTFEAGDVLGLCVRLMRSSPSDTFDQAIKLFAAVRFEYTAKHL